MKHIIAITFALICLASANAAPIVFEHRGEGSGTLAGIPFSKRPFVITAYGDTENRIGVAPRFYINHSRAQIELAGIGTFQYTIGTCTGILQYYPVENWTPAVTFSPANFQGNDLFNTVNPAYATWDMLTSIGPFSGTAVLFSGGGVTTTTGGLLQFTNTQVGQGTFSARIVPEPALFSMLSLLGMFLLSVRFRSGVPFSPT